MRRDRQNDSLYPTHKSSPSLLSTPAWAAVVSGVQVPSVPLTHQPHSGVRQPNLLLLPAQCIAHAEQHQPEGASALPKHLALPCSLLPKIAWRGQREDPAKLWVMPGWYQEQTNHLPGKQSPAPLTWPVTVAQAGKNKYFVHQIAVWHPQGQQCKCSLPRPWMHQRLTAVH